MSDPIVSIRDLQYRYRGQKEFALDGINLDLSRGEFLVVMGPSEAGKSTLAATINGLIPHFQKGKLKGDVLVMGRNTRDNTVAQMAEIVGIVFQDFEAQLFSTNVELEVAFGPENFAVARDEMLLEARGVTVVIAHCGIARPGPIVQCHELVERTATPVSPDQTGHQQFVDPRDRFAQGAGANPGDVLRPPRQQHFTDLCLESRAQPGRFDIHRPDFS